MTFETKTSPLWPMPEPDWATFCQLWPVVPSMMQVVVNSMVGVTQLTSETSVDPRARNQMPQRVL